MNGEIVDGSLVDGHRLEKDEGVGVIDGDGTVFGSADEIAREGEGGRGEEREGSNGRRRVGDEGADLRAAGEVIELDGFIVGSGGGHGAGDGDGCDGGEVR